MERPGAAVAAGDAQRGRTGRDSYAWKAGGARPRGVDAKSDGEGVEERLDDKRREIRGKVEHYEVQYNQVQYDEVEREVHWENNEQGASGKIVGNAQVDVIDQKEALITREAGPASRVVAGPR